MQKYIRLCTVSAYYMCDEGNLSSRALSQTSGIMHYETLVSRPGISQPDSNFIWGSTFKAPIGISLKDDKAFFDIFLPEEAQNEPDKKLFLNRVGAKLQDGIWHVRRSDDQLRGVYGPALRFALTSFNTLFNDYSYIENGRIYLHFLFNETDISAVSKVFLSLDTESLGLRLEYLRKLKNGGTAFQDLQNTGNTVSVTIEASREAEPNDEAEEITFLMDSTLNNGVRTVSYSQDGSIPDILKPQNIQKVDSKVNSFFCSNEIVMRLMDLMLDTPTVFYGYHGIANRSRICLTVNLPKPLTASLLRTIGKIEQENSDYSIRLREVVDFT